MRITPDKWKHFYVGIVLGAVLLAAGMAYWPLQSGTALIVSISLLVAICYGFELYSLLTGRGHYELLDAIAGILGGGIGFGLIYFLQHL